MHAGTEGTALKTRAVHGLVRNPIFIYFLDRQKKKKSFQLALVFSQPTYVLLKYKLPTGSSFCSPCRPKLFNWLYLCANLQDSVHLSAAKSLQINLRGKKIKRKSRESTGWQFASFHSWFCSFVLLAHCNKLRSCPQKERISYFPKAQLVAALLQFTQPPLFIHEPPETKVLPPLPALSFSLASSGSTGVQSSIASFLLSFLTCLHTRAQPPMKKPEWDLR